MTPNPSRHRRKGEMSINAAAAIFLGIIGMLLVLAFLSKTTGGKQFYCANVQPILGRLGVAQEELCIETKRLETEYGTERIKNLTTFPNHNVMQNFRIAPPSPQRFSRNLTRDSKIIAAQMTVANGNPRSIINRFEGRDYVTVLTYDFNGGTQTLYLNLTRNAKVTRARLKARGYNVPGRIDIVFAIDQSSSMYNEWSAICSVIDQLKQNISKTGLGVDVQSTIYGISDFGERTTGACKNREVTNAQIDSVNSAVGIPFPQWGVPTQIGPNSWQVQPYEQYNEAWGESVYWLSKNHGWRENTKRIIFPVSDADPTGGGPTQMQTDNSDPPQIIRWLNDAVFSSPGRSSENKIIDAADAAAQAAGVYIFPIYGDDSANEPIAKRVEGYHVGSGNGACDPNTDMQCGCDPQYNAVCRPVIDWMRQLAQYPKSRIAGYQNPEELKKFAQFVLATNFPQDVVIAVNGIEIFRHDGTFIDQESIDEDRFIQALEAASAACAQPYCMVPVEVSSSGEGAVVLSDLDIIAQRYIQDAEVKLNDKRIFNDSHFVGSARITFTPQATAEMDACVTSYCLLNFSVHAGEQADILLSNLSIRYRKLFIDEDVLEAVLACHRDASAQNFARKIRCAEFTIPSDHKFYLEFNESVFSDLLENRKWCGMVQNSDYGCGVEDQVRFAHPFNNPTNVLIEYDPTRRQVVVS